MITTKTRSIKANKDLMDHFTNEAEKKGDSFNSRIVAFMKRDSKFKPKKA